MKRLLSSLWLLAALALTSCYTQKANVMTMESYYEIQPGMSADHLVSIYGQPISKTQMDNGTMVYVYQERLTMGTANSVTVSAKRYYFMIDDKGKIKSKKVVIANQPGYEPTLNDLNDS